ncbi:MAG TPA: hypothetical protein QF753_03350 [Victivallales bacterium]|nr:hypothetical protein [Victivallales bacterium]
MRNDPDYTMDYLNELNNHMKDYNINNPNSEVQVVLPNQLNDLECQATNHSRPN